MSTVNGADANRILLEILNGVVFNERDTEAQRTYREAVRQEVNEIHEAGGSVELPHEWP